MKLIVGLGNPGKTYEKTRHNVGWLALDKFSNEWKGDPVVWKSSTKRKASIAKLTLKDEQILLAKPQTFMNVSGEAVQTLMHFYKLSSDDLILIHDDLDLPIGKIKLSLRSGSAGHKGVASVIQNLGTKQIKRIRIGIGTKEKALGAGADFVLGRFTKDELDEIDPALEQVASALYSLIDNNISAARKALQQPNDSHHKIRSSISKVVKRNS